MSFFTPDHYMIVSLKACTLAYMYADEANNNCTST